MSFFRKNRGHQSKSGQRRSYRPNLEGFEDRIVPAGNVTAVIVGGTLVVTGDAENNQIKITGSTRGPVDIQAIDSDTIINDQPGMVTLLGFRGGLVVDLGDGNDQLVVNRVNGTPSVNMGTGNDFLLFMSATSGGMANLNLGSGDDIMKFAGADMRGGVRADAGAGSDQIELNGVQFGGGASFLGGGGVDSIGYVNSRNVSLPAFSGFAQTVGAQLPRTQADTGTVARGGTTTVSVLTNDAANVPNGSLDNATLRIVEGPAHGTATVLPDGKISYTHDNSFTSRDSLHYVVSNNRGAISNIATVFFTITGFSGPTVTLTTTAVSPTKTTPLPYTATFSEDVTGFALSDITVTNGTASSLVRVNAKTYRFNVAPTTSGAVTVSVAAGVAQNSLGLTNSASSPSTVTFDSAAPIITINSSTLKSNDSTPTLTGTINDSSATVKVVVNGQTYTATVSGTTWTANVTNTLAAGTFPVTATATDPVGNVATATGDLVLDVTPPTVTITSTTPSTTPLATIPIKITFSEPVGSFTDASDIVVTGATVTRFFAQLGGSVYEVDLAPTGPGTVTVVVNAGVANDQAGNLNSASPTFTRTSTVQPAPTVAITTPTNPTNSATIPITVTFSQDVEGFEQDDIVVGNGTLSNFVAVDGKTYTATVTATGPGTVTVDVAAGKAENAGGTLNTAAPRLSVAYSASAPAVIISSTVTGPTSSPTIPITITFSVDVTDFVAGDVVVGNGTLSNFSAVNARTYTATVTATANGSVTVDVPANVAQGPNTTGNLAAAQLAVAFAAPTITTTAANPSSTATLPITITFNENVTGFDANDIVVGNGTLTNFVAVNPRTYTATVTATSDGVVTVNVAANAAQNFLSLGTAAAAQLSVTVNTNNNTAPTVARTIANVTVAANAANKVFTVAGTFDDANVGQSTATLNIMQGTTARALNLVFFDRDAPASVNNFFNYTGRYAAENGTMFHRFLKDFVIQGGGFSTDDFLAAPQGSKDSTPHIDTDSTIPNEFKPAHSNVAGTLTMARSNALDSASSEFFLNLVNNTFLDSGPYAVFGQVVGAAELAILTDINNNMFSVDFPNSSIFGGPDAGVPLTSNTTSPTINDMLRVVNLVATHRDSELTYTVQSSNTSVVTASAGGFNGNQVTLDYLTAGTSTITVTATDSVGHAVSTTFTVTVT